MRKHAALFQFLCLAGVLCGLPNARAAGGASRLPLPKLAGLTLSLLAVVVCVGAGLLALAVLYAILKPGVVRAGSEHLRGQVFRSFVTGVLSLVFLVLVGANMHILAKPFSDWLGLALILLLAYLTLTGFAFAAHCVGENLLANLENAGAGSDVRKILLGGGLLVSINLLPIVGQLVTLAVLVCGLGEKVHDLLRNHRRTQESNGETLAKSDAQP